MVAGRPGAEGLVSERVGSVELCLLVSRGHALASRKALALADLEGALLAEPYDSRWLKATVLELLSRHGVRPRMASLEMSAARHHGFLHEDGGAVLVDVRCPPSRAVPGCGGGAVLERGGHGAARHTLRGDGRRPPLRMAALAGCSARSEVTARGDGAPIEARPPWAFFAPSGGMRPRCEPSAVARRLPRSRCVSPSLTAIVSVNGR